MGEQVQSDAFQDHTVKVYMGEKTFLAGKLNCRLSIEKIRYLHDLCTIWANHMHADDFVGLDVHQDLHEPACLIARKGVLHGPADEDSTASCQHEGLGCTQSSSDSGTFL